MRGTSRLVLLPLAALMASRMPGARGGGDGGDCLVEEPSHGLLSIRAPAGGSMFLPTMPLVMDMHIDASGADACSRAVRESRGANWSLCYGPRRGGPASSSARVTAAKCVALLSEAGTPELFGGETLYRGSTRRGARGDARPTLDVEAWLSGPLDNVRCGSTTVSLDVPRDLAVVFPGADGDEGDGPRFARPEADRWVFFASGSCRLLGALLDGRGVGQVLHGLTRPHEKGACGPNFLGTLHTSAEHLQFLRWFLRENRRTTRSSVQPTREEEEEASSSSSSSASGEEMPEAALLQLLRAHEDFDHDHPECVSTDLVEVKRADLGSRFEDADVYFFEISSMKVHRSGPWVVRSPSPADERERTSLFELAEAGGIAKETQTPAELRADLEALLDLIPRNKTVVLQSHVRPQLLDPHQAALSSREAIRAILESVVADHDPSRRGQRLVHVDPTDVFRRDFVQRPEENVNHLGLPKDDLSYWTHLSSVGETRLFWALLDAAGLILRS